jgi:hypothetical protein
VQRGKRDVTCPRQGVIKNIIGATSSDDSWQAVLYWNLEGKTQEQETEESPLLRSITRKRLFKTLQAAEDLAFSDL